VKSVYRQPGSESGRGQGGLIITVLVLGILIGGAITLGALHFDLFGSVGDNDLALTNETRWEPVEQGSGQKEADPPAEVIDGYQRNPDDPIMRETETLHNDRCTAIVQAADRVGPAVVSIWVTQTRRHNPYASNGGSFDEFFSMFFNRPRQSVREEPVIGSGVIIDPRGVIVTNHHVIRNASKIMVSLPDGRSFEASVVGSDPLYDLGVIRIEGDDLPSASVGNSDDLLVGEWAICLGNPFGFLLDDYQPTVTAGVISATNRDIKSPQSNQRYANQSGNQAIYKGMIQTDAAVNPGNSGGPLVNSLGEVVGINTFIFSTGGGNLGMGFAIPINTVVRVAGEILEYGHVRDYWIGIKAQDITRGLASYFNIRDTHGVLVWTLDEGSPAARAGIQIGDIIRRVNGEPVSSARDAQRLIFGATIGDTLVLTIERDAQTADISILLEERPSN